MRMNAQEVVTGGMGMPVFQPPPSPFGGAQASLLWVLPSGSLHLYHGFFAYRQANSKRAFEITAEGNERQQANYAPSPELI